MEEDSIAHAKSAHHRNVSGALIIRLSTNITPKLGTLDVDICKGD